MLTNKLLGATTVGEPDYGDDFVLEIDTTLGDLTFEFPIASIAASSDVVVDWGDGTQDTYTTIGTKTHTYSQNGVYIIRASGGLTGFGAGISAALPRPELTKCLSFGNIGLLTLAGAFWGCSNITYAPNALPSSVFHLGSCFRECSQFNADIGAWDVRNVWSMRDMFRSAASFNQPIGEWETFSLLSAANMFDGATNFNQDLKRWPIGLITYEPVSFAVNSALSASNKPVWGYAPAHQAAGSITYVGQATGVNSATLPAHQVGDLILAFGFNDINTTSITLPAGWTSIGTSSFNTVASVLGYKVAASNSETSDTWTNATTVIFLVYRGVDVTGIASCDTITSGTAANVSYPANGFWKGLSRVVAFAGHRSTDTALGTPPSGLSLIVNPADATDEAAAFHSTVDNYGDWPVTSVAVGGTAAAWHTYALRLRVPLVKI